LASNSTINEDKLLWQAFLLGDELAFTALYQRHIKTLFSYGKKLLADDDAVEDLIQDLFIDLWQSRSRLSEVESPRFYLFRSLRRRIHKSLSPIQQRGQNWESVTEDTLPVSLPQEFLLIEEEGVQKQKNSLDFWLKSLPLRQHEVLILRYYQDFSYAEISEILTINEQSVRNLIQRGLLKLRQLSIHSILLLLFLKIFLPR
jgi:RNA polymerase sigma factor (sigma-70 family)